MNIYSALDLNLGPYTHSKVWRYFFVFFVTILVLAAIKYPINDFLEVNGIIWVKSDILPSESLELILIAVFLAPLLEECAFRLPQSSRLDHTFLGAIILGLILYENSLAFNKFLVAVLILFYLFQAIYHASSTNYQQSKLIQRTQLIYSSVVFGLIHLDNYLYNDEYTFILLAPLIVIVQTFLGFFSSILRTKGFVYPLLLHGSYNAILVAGHLLFERH